MRTLVLLFLFTMLVIFSGCASKPNVVYKTQEVKIPVRCQVSLPKKPKYTGTFESARSLSEYYIEVEDLLRICIGASNGL